MIGHLPSWIVLSAGAVADISYSGLIPAVVSTTLALVAVVLRLYSRARLSRKIGTEDILVAAALVGTPSGRQNIALTKADLISG
jgi:hypothetical protein